MKFGFAAAVLFFGALANAAIDEHRELEAPYDEAQHEDGKLIQCIESHTPNQFNQCLPGSVVQTSRGNRNLEGIVMTTEISDGIITTPDSHTSDSTKFMDPCANLPIDPNDRAAAGWNTMPSNDDLSTSLPIPFDFSLFGTIYKKMESLLYINNNGNISFERSYEDYTASGFPIEGVAMIAPFWSDIDTRGPGNGQLWYKSIAENTFSVIWDRVGYYNEKTDLRNTFQVVISDGSNEKFGLGNNVCFCYGDMDWTTGSASGGVDGFDGVPATAGINRGKNNNYVQLGRFSKPGTLHDGPGGSIDGVDWLDNQGYENFAEGAMASSPVCFDATIENVPPVVSGFPMGEIIASTCGVKLEFNLTFATPELDQVIKATIPQNEPAGMIITKETRPNGESVNVNIKWSPAEGQEGTYVLEFEAEDNYEEPAVVRRSLTIRVVGGSCSAADELPEKCILLLGMDDTCAVNPRPYCTPYRSPDHCPADQSFPLLVKDREEMITKYFTDLDAGEEADLNGHWFQHLEDKGAAYAFTRSNMYPTSPIYCCTDAADNVDDCFGAGNGRGAPQTNFVIRASGMHSTRGIYVFPGGFDEVELLTGKRMSLTDVQSELMTMEPLPAKYIVEKFIDGRGSDQTQGVPKLPTEYKFHMFNGKIGSVSVFHNRGGDCPCYLEVDEDWERMDKYGCFVPSMPMGLNADGDTCYDIDFEAGKLNPYTFKDFDLCGAVKKPSACAWNKMIDIATDLSTKIGVYMRIDIFLTDDDQIYVQEYTRNHNGGLRHCASQKKADGCVDSCVLGTMWKNAGGEAMFGGPKTLTPALLDGYSTLPGENQCIVISDANMAANLASQECRLPVPVTS